MHTSLKVPRQTNADTQRPILANNAQGSNRFKTKKGEAYILSSFSSIFSTKRRLLAVLACLALAATSVVMCSPAQQEHALPRLAKDEIIVLRTPGGLLEVTTLIRNEEFRWSTKHTCPIINCEDLFGPTNSEVRVPVHYTYRIPLATEWSLRSMNDHFELAVPMPVPKLPAAIDVNKLEIRTDKGWFSPNKTDHRESVVRNLGPEFDRRAKQKNYLDAQREDARKTVAEFAQKWMLAQGVAEKLRGYPIRVIFPDDPHPQ